MKKLCRVLPNTQETKEYLDTLPKIYLVACWAKWGVMDFPFIGKFKYDKFRAHKKVPLVYQYDDHNGTDDSYYLRPITYTTTGAIDSWTLDRDEAYRRAKEKNKAKNEVKIEQNNEIKSMKCLNCGFAVNDTITTDKTTYTVDLVHHDSITGINSGQCVNPNTNTTISKGE